METSLEKKMKSAGLMPEDFSWARFQPSKRNLLLMEMGDVPILEQKYMTIGTLVWISLLLDMQLTNLSPEHLLRFVINIGKSLVRMAADRMRSIRQYVQR